jgi:hypothetical protein
VSAARGGAEQQTAKATNKKKKPKKTKTKKLFVTGFFSRYVSRYI